MINFSFFFFIVVLKKFSFKELKRGENNFNIVVASRNCGFWKAKGDDDEQCLKAIDNHMNEGARG